MSGSFDPGIAWETIRRKLTYQSRCHAHESHEDVRETHLENNVWGRMEGWKMQPLAVQIEQMGMFSKRARFEKTV